MRRERDELGRYLPRPLVCGRKHCARCGRWRHACDFACVNGELVSWCRTCKGAWHRVHYRDEPSYSRRLEYMRIYHEAKRREAGMKPRQFSEERPLPRSLNPELDAGPLVALFEQHIYAERSNGHPDFSWNDLARQIGMPSRTVRRWRAGAKVRTTSADRVCVALGYTLTLVYGELA
jgi:hypothetical protein